MEMFLVSECPDHQRIVELLQGRRPAEEVERFRQHKAHCPRCQEEVKRVAEVLLLGAAMEHVSYEDLSAASDDALDVKRRLLIDAHLSGCALCRQRFAELRQGRMAAQEMPIITVTYQPVPETVAWHQRWLERVRAWGRARQVGALAAATAVVLLAFVGFQQLHTPDWTDSGEVRSTQRDQRPRITVTSPKEGKTVTTSRPKLSWQEVKGATRYHVEVVDDRQGNVVFQQDTTKTETRPDKPLKNGSYVLTVQMKVEGKTVVSDDVRFRVRVRRRNERRLTLSPELSTRSPARPALAPIS